jgi:hypothetical protein
MQRPRCRPPFRSQLRQAASSDFAKSNQQPRTCEAKLQPHHPQAEPSTVLMLPPWTEDPSEMKILASTKIRPTAKQVVTGQADVSVLLPWAVCLFGAYDLGQSPASPSESERGRQCDTCFIDCCCCFTSDVVFKAVNILLREEQRAILWRQLNAAQCCFVWVMGRCLSVPDMFINQASSNIYQTLWLKTKNCLEWIFYTSDSSWRAEFREIGLDLRNYLGISWDENFCPSESCAKFLVLRNHLGGISRDWYLTYRTISVGFRETDFFTFGIISVGFHEIDFSPSESSRWDFARLIFTPSELFLWSFHLRNHLGGISRYEFFTIQSYLGS